MQKLPQGKWNISQAVFNQPDREQLSYKIEKLSPKADKKPPQAKQKPSDHIETKEVRKVQQKVYTFYRTIKKNPDLI